ncbi:MAG: Rieske (2Fe-2S) domain protein [Actinomycetia bacterium]|nr:Rieske (2Fe-2S) domain protein [Actinomycetes bacterium]
MTAVTPVDVVHNEHPMLRRAWHPVAYSSEVGAEPFPVRLLGEYWVLARLPELVAFVDRCPHRAAPLSAGAVVDGQLRCGYHGWEFAANGACARVPALGADGRIPSGFALDLPFAVEERFGLVWMALEEPIAPMLRIPEYADATAVLELAPKRTAVNAAALTDNFLDVTHFPFLHATTFGTPDMAEVVEYRTERDGWMIAFEQEGKAADADGSVSIRRSRYECTAPFALRLWMHWPGTPRWDTILFFAQPEAHDSTRMYKVVVLGGTERSAEELAKLAAFEVDILEEDLRMLERLRDDWLPLRADAELHTRADRGGLAWRRMLADLATEVGT